MTDMPNAKPAGTMGQRLMAWLDPELEARGTTPNAFGKLVEFDPSSFSRWRDGRIEMPSISVFRNVADALGVSLLTVLDGVGLLNKEEKAGIERVVEAAPADIDYAIEHDPSLSDEDKELFRLIRRGRGRGGSRVRRRT